jgi:hypothetical protein
MTSHMKKKAKRYQEGGEAEDKKRGLAASNKEGSVGFFERLRMGNIDDPKSKAYKRFGAGRGQAETAKEKQQSRLTKDHPKLAWEHQTARVHLPAQRERPRQKAAC